MIADPLIHPSYMAQRFVKPFTLFMSDMVRQKPGSCLVEDAVAYLQKNASLLGRNIDTVTDAAAHFERERYERSLYDSYPFPEAGIYGLPDLFYNSSPQAAVYYCEHKDLRQNQFAKKMVQPANQTANYIPDVTMYVAEGLLLLQAALYFCSRYYSLKGLFGWACNAEMLQLLKPHITKRKVKDALPVLEIADITALPYVLHYLQTNGFMEMTLAQTHLRAKIFSKSVLEADDTELLFFGWG